MQFNPSRLILARKRRGLSKAALARKSGLGLRSLVYYESGEFQPTKETAESLAEALKLPLDFFYGDDLEEITCDAASFRSLSTMTAAQRDSALAAGSFAISLSKWIEERFELPSPTVPSLRNFDPETAAHILRDHWGLGKRPISNMVHVLEAHGVRVFSLPVDSAAVDAFSGWHRETPFVFLNPLKSGERGRTDAAHELGHLTLHGHGIPRSRQAELEADHFAACFLMPAQDVLAHVPRALSLKAILKMKARWRVSAISLVHRLKSLDLLTDWQYRTFCIQLSRLGFRSGEPGGIPRESSQIFAKVFDTLRSEGTPRKLIAQDLMISSAELDSLLVGLAMFAGVTSDTTKNPRSARSRPKQATATREKSTLRAI